MNFSDEIKAALGEELEDILDSLDESKAEVKKTLADIADHAVPKLLSSNQSIREQGQRNLAVLNTKLAALLSIEASESLIRVKSAIERGVAIGLNALLAGI